MNSSFRISPVVSLLFSRLWVLVFLLSAHNISHAQTEFIPLGSTWHYLDNGSDQGTAWKETVFDSSSWSSGPAQLGYGDGDEATVVSFGTDSGNKYITTYFRHTFNVADPAAISNLFLEVIRDDGVIVYLNGAEVFRSNMPGGNVNYLTQASSALGGSAESTLQTGFVDSSNLVTGANVLAVEIHQANNTSSDISFDLRLSDFSDITVTRGPYLQNASSDGLTVRWRTNIPSDSVVRYGTDQANLNGIASSASTTMEHVVEISGLNPDTRYFYSVGDSSVTLAEGTDYFFETHPIPGTLRSTRIWVIGDSGTANANAAAVKNAFIGVNQGPHADVWLMLGDNAYNDGTDSEYQSAVFDMYPSILRNSVLWSTLGNHDGHSADSATQSGPYYDIFTLPAAAEAGGVASGTEAYYSFDYANIHFVCLDSYETSRSSSGAMALWLENDLSATTQEWIIAYWHHPPYTKGSHNSDTEAALIEMREVFVPVFEDYGVDLVLSGHSHSYERSMLIDGHYGASGTFNSSMIKDAGDGNPSGDGEYVKEPVPHDGAVFAVAGSSGKISGGSLDHPVMITSLNELGSMIIDVYDHEMDVRFINDAGIVRDAFRIRHDSISPPAAPSSLTATAQSSSEIDLAWVENAVDETSVEIERSLDQNTWQNIASLPANATAYNDTGLEAGITYYYRAYAANLAGNSSFSNIANATTDPPPPYTDHYAYQESTVFGTVSGSYLNTIDDDDTAESIAEESTSGNPNKRRSRLEHIWRINVQSGSSLTLMANAWSGGSTDGDTFRFDYSTDQGSTWTEGFIVSSIDPGNVQSIFLNTGLTDSVWVRVTDTDRQQGNSLNDRVFIDQLLIRSHAPTGNPPADPDGLSATLTPDNKVSLSWNDNAGNETGYEIERKLEADTNWQSLVQTPADVANYTDSSVLPGETYEYRVRAFNGSGFSGFSGTDSVSTLPGITLSTNGFKAKGKVIVQLSWTGANTANVDIYLNNSLHTTVPDTGSYLDETGQKNGMFSYQVCEANSKAICSNTSVVNF